MFPTDAERLRSQRAEQNYALFRGNYSVVLTYFRNEYERRNSIEVVQPITGSITRVFADLMFLKKPRVEHGEKAVQDAIDDFVWRNKLGIVLHESAHTQSYNGRAYFEMRLVDDLAYIEELNPAYVFPQYSALSVSGDPSAVVISWDTEIDGKNYRFVKTHTVGKITYKLHTLKGKGKNAKIDGEAPITLLGDDMVPEEDTGLDFIPVYWVDNHKTGRDLCGISDYDDIRSLLTELVRVETQIATQLRKHANAKMAVPPGVLNNKGKVRAEDMEMIEVGQNDTGGLNKPEYIVNANPLIDAAIKQREAILEEICRVSEVSATLLDINVAGGVERVGALRLRMLRTLAKVERKLRPYDRMLRDMFIDMLKWEKVKGGDKVKPTDFTISFSNGLPEDALENAQVQQIRYSAGLQTLEDALRKLDGIEGEPLKEKVKAIEAAKEKDMANIGNQVPAINFGA